MSPAGEGGPPGSVGQARRLLARRNGWIAADPPLYVIRVGPDRRARPRLTIDETVFRQLAENPGLRGRPGGGWAPRVRPGPVPDGPGPGRPGVIDGVRGVMNDNGSLTTHRANLGHSAVVWLARRLDASGRPWLGPAEIAAADRLARDAEAALRGPSVTMRWDALPRSGAGRAATSGPGPGGGALAASQRVERALAACGPARGLVEAICIHSSALQAAERDLGLSRRRGKVLLKTGLSDLAAHYRIG